MYTEEEINVVGIIPESELIDSTNKKELERIVYDALGLGPIFEPLMMDIENKGLVERSGEIKQ